MKMTIKGTQMDLSADLHQHIDEKIAAMLTSFGGMDLEAVTVDVEVEKTTKHHQKGDDLYRAEINVSVPGDMLRAEETASNPEAAVDLVKETMSREIRKWREKKADRRRRGAREAKETLHNFE